MTIYTPQHVADAEARIAEKRARLFATLGDVQDRLSPSNLAQDAVESAAASVASAVKKGTDAVRSRPLAVAGAAGAIGLVLARGWIAEIFKGRKNGETAKPPERSKPKRATRAKKGPAS